MQNVQVKITEEIANIVLNTDKSYKTAYEPYCSPGYTCGYGYYGCSEPYQENDEWFVTILIGDTCD